MSASNDSTGSNNGSDLTAKVEAWLGAEGYPLEYFTSAALKAAGFRVHQGTFVRREPGGSPREVDVVADWDIRGDHRFLRVSTVVECKWSGDKPVVIFTDPYARMAPSACISQTIASDVGDALIWLLRGDERVQALSMFGTPEVPGFGGRQAFGSKDNFYAAMAAVTGACADLVSDADRRYEEATYIQEYGLLTFPVIVLDGKLLEASYDEESGRLNTKEVERSRIHWRGSPSFPLIASIDVVTRKALRDFAAERARDVQVLLPLLKEQLEGLIAAFLSSDRSMIFGERGPSGRGNAPRLLQVLFDKAQGDSPEAPTSPKEEA